VFGVRPWCGVTGFAGAGEQQDKQQMELTVSGAEFGSQFVGAVEVGLEQHLKRYHTAQGVQERNLLPLLATLVIMSIDSLRREADRHGLARTHDAKK
jgi:hypothetical protein